MSISRIANGASAPGRADALVGDARDRRRQALCRRERLTALVFGIGFATVAAGMLLLLPHHRSASLATIAALVVAYAASSRVEFEVGAGSAVPTELVLVPMLFVLPTGLVPVCVAAGLILGGAVDHARRSVHPERLLVSFSSSWHAVGPALVFAAAGVDGLTWQDWPVYVAALAAQLGFDFASSAGADWLGHGVSPRESMRFLFWVYLVDVLLVPVSLLVAFAAAGRPAVVLTTVPLIALLAVFARQRRERLDGAFELADVRRGDAVIHDTLRAVLAEPDLSSALGRVTAAFGDLVPGAELAIDATVAPHDHCGLDGGRRSSQESPGATISVPMMVRGAVAGAVTLRRGNGSAFTPREVELARRLADSAAVAFAAHAVA